MKLAVAGLKRAEQVCREKFDAPLTVIYWDETPLIQAQLEEAGLDVIPLSEIVGDDWRSLRFRYYLFDLHPNANANRAIGKFLAEKYAEK